MNCANVQSGKILIPYFICRNNNGLSEFLIIISIPFIRASRSKVNQNTVFRMFGKSFDVGRCVLSRISPNVCAAFWTRMYGIVA